MKDHVKPFQTLKFVYVIDFKTMQPEPTYTTQLQVTIVDVSMQSMIPNFITSSPKIN